MFFLMHSSLSLSFLHTNTVSHLSLFICPRFPPQLDAEKQYHYTPPTQLPIRPPYEQACRLRKNNLLSKEDALSAAPSQSRDQTETLAESS